MPAARSQQPVEPRLVGCGQDRAVEDVQVQVRPDIEFSVARGAAPIATFGATSSTALLFPTWLAVSETDAWAEVEWSSQLAQTWDTHFVNLGDCGHVNAARGHGPWGQGLELLRQVSASY